jgi:FtsP/CotA-like multicopper oxidase with cupredoxin domain
MIGAAALLALLATAATPVATAAAAPSPPPPTPKQHQRRQNFSFTLPPQRLLPGARPFRKVTIDARLGRRSPDGVPRDLILVAGTDRANTAADARAPATFQPAIVVSQGDELELKLVNSLPPSYPQAGGGISVHQHGFSMADGQAAWHDGAAEISACKVPPLSASAKAAARQTNERVARFVVRERPGTYFWHDHTSLLRGDGLMGGLIVTPPPWAPQAPLAMLPGSGFGGDDPSSFPRAPNKSAWDAPPERLIFLTDWWHHDQDAMALRFNRPFDPAKQTNDTRGKWHWIGLPKSVLINGKGSYAACEDVTTRSLGKSMRNGIAATSDDLLLPDGVAGQLKPTAAFPTCNVTGLLTPSAAAAAAASSADDDEKKRGFGAPEVIDVPRGQTTLLRVVNAANLVYLSFCVRDHWLRVVAADAVPVAPYDAFECVDLNAGQRLDVLLVANVSATAAGTTTGTSSSSDGLFWISASPQYRKGAPTGYAVLRYVDGDSDEKAVPPPPLLDRLPPQDRMLQPADAVSRAKSLDALLRIHPLLRTPEKEWSSASLLSVEERRLLRRAVQAVRAAGNQAPRWDSPEGRRYGPPPDDEDGGALVGPGAFSPPQNVSRRYVLRTTQPLIEANGFIRWAVNNVATSMAPDCPPLLRELYEEGRKGGNGKGGGKTGDGDKKGSDAASSSSSYFQRHRMDTSLTRDQLLKKFPDGGLYFAGAFDRNATTLGPGASPGVAVFDGSGDDEVLVRAKTPRAGMHAISLPIDEEIELVFVNERAGANGGEYGDPNPAANPFSALVSNRSGIEQHPWHSHGYHVSVVGQGRGLWSLEDVKSYNLVDPPLRDTWSLLGPAPGTGPVGGWTAVRFRTSNAGVWPVHCHIAAHQMLGQMVNLVVGDVSADLAPPPSESSEARALCSEACHYQFAASPPSVGKAMFGDRMAPDSNVGFETLKQP